MKKGRGPSGRFRKKYNSDFGKVCPAVVIQNDIANRVTDQVAFKGVTLLPMTTRLVGGSLRMRVAARDKLEKTSEICTLDISRIDLQRCLTTLRAEELREIAQKPKGYLAI